MEEEKKRTVKVFIVVACLLAAVVVYSITRPKSSSTVEPVDKLWVKCSNPDCEATYQVDRDEYFLYLHENQDPFNPGVTPPMLCQECSEQSVYLANKCPECGNVFFDGEAEDEDYHDRCPECGYSKRESKKKGK